MEKHEVDNQHMEALQALAKTNLKVSEAKNLLISLQEQETDYLIGREEKAIARIQVILNESDDVLGQISKNYADSVDLSREVSDMCRQISDLLTLFKEVKQRFAEKCDEWDKQIGIKEDSLAELQKGLKVQRALIDNDKETVERMRNEMAIDRRKLDDDKAELERSIKRFKEGKV